MRPESIARRLKDDERTLLVSLPTKSWNVPELNRLKQLGLARIDVTVLVITPKGTLVKAAICSECLGVKRGGVCNCAVAPS